MNQSDGTFTTFNMVALTITVAEAPRLELSANIQSRIWWKLCRKLQAWKIERLARVNRTDSVCHVLIGFFFCNVVNQQIPWEERSTAHACFTWPCACFAREHCLHSCLRCFDPAFTSLYCNTHFRIRAVTLNPNDPLYASTDWKNHRMLLNRYSLFLLLCTPQHKILFPRRWHHPQILLQSPRRLSLLFLSRDTVGYILRSLHFQKKIAQASVERKEFEDRGLIINHGPNGNLPISFSSISFISFRSEQ